MNSNFYVALAGQLAMQKRVETIAHNVANVATPGFRAESISFDSQIAQTGTTTTSFPTTGRNFYSNASGGLSQSGSPLDVAVDGDAWFAVASPRGTVLTRDGRMHLSPGGQLLSVTGAPYLDAGGAPITVDPNGGPLSIGRDGRITQNNRALGSVGLYTIDSSAKLERFENSGVIPDTPANPVVDFSRVGVIQGSIENSNVNPVAEMSRLIDIQRTFDAISNTLGSTESAFESSIRDLGSAK